PPLGLVVLRVAVVVAPLGAPQFVAVQQHGYALRQQQGRDEVPLLAGAERQDLLVVGGSFHPEVRRGVVGLTVVVVLAVGLVVLVVVRHEVAQREAVMGGDE